jgi:pimeloyl-ACP methyl ester carboxylesterase
VDALLAEYVSYHELAAELCTLRATHPLLVVTAHTGLRTRRWRTHQIRLAAALGAEHITIAPAGHLVMVEQPLRTADCIRSIAAGAQSDNAGG